MIKETEKISVYNYNENRVSLVVSPDRSYSFDPSPDGVTPCVIPMTLDEIRYANNSGAFRNGTLFFEKSKEKEVYDILGIQNWKDILSNEDIKEIILHPTYDGLTKLINIKDSAVFERVRTAYQKLIIEGTNDISVRVEQIIKTRYKELLNKQVNTSIVLTKKDIPEEVDTKEVDELKAQNQAMQEQMAQMQKLLEQMMAAQNATAEKPEEQTEPKKTTTRTKKTA